MKRIWILFYYNSLPDMPKGCKLFSSDIMHRDFFMCNPTNTGHYEYPKFENRSYDEGCHKREVPRFLDKSESEKYVIFYTRHTTLKRRSKNKIVGYFKVGRQFNKSKPKRGFRASETVLLPKDKCISISYSGRGVPVSWGRLKGRKMSEIENALEHLIKVRERLSINIFKKYQQETKKIMGLSNNENKRKAFREKCVSCKKEECYLRHKLLRKKIKMGILEIYKRKRKCR